MFESPDENANYLATKLYADTGQLWYSEDYTELDAENYLHPRHFVTYNDRIVPTQFLGLPVVYGPLYSIAGDNAAIIWVAVFSLISFVYFVRLAFLLFGRRGSQYAALLFIATMPLLYNLSMPYLNAAAAVSFFICGSYYLARFYHSTANGNLFLASLFFSLSIFFRYEFAIFIGLLLVITLANKYKRSLRAYVKPMALSIVVIAFFAIVPILALNHRVYGDVLTSGTKLLQVYSIEREPWGFWQLLLPNTVIPETIFANVYRLIFRLLPLVTLLSVLGIISYIRNGKFNRYKLLYGILFVYLLIYSGSSETWNAFNFDYLGFNTSIIRYWLIPYIFLALMAVEGFSLVVESYRRLVPVLAIALVVTSFSGLLIDNERSMTRLSYVLDKNQRTAETISAEIDESSIVYTDSYDKLFAPFGIHVATWWDRENGYNPRMLAASMARVHENTSYSVYLYTSSIDLYIDAEELNAILQDQKLLLESSQNIRYLYKLKEAQPKGFGWK